MSARPTRFFLAALAVAAACALPSFARLVASHTYEEMSKEADLVVIAVPVSTRDTTERANLTNIAPRLPVIGVETTFEISALLKGELRAAPAEQKKTLVLHHYRMTRSDTPIINGPLLVSFDPKVRKAYLMFLKRESDGRYQAFTGQTDPELSIEPLRWQR